MSRMVEVVIDSLRVSLTNQQRIVLLREVNHERYLPIWIGPNEAEAITIALQEIEVVRPQTHDLLKNIMTALNVRLVRVEVVTLKEDVFYANLVIDSGGKMINLDARPSDALAMATRWHVPILVDREVMDAAGVQPDRDVQQQAQAAEVDENIPSAEGESSNKTKDGEGRLSVFEDFLQNLDLGNLDEPDDDNNPDSEDQP